MTNDLIDINMEELLQRLSNLDNFNKYANVSVIIPCYQAEKTLSRAIKSISDQTLLPREIILIDDASTDNTPLLLTLFKQINPRLIKTLSLHSNNGVSHARNCGWQIASQPYICFLDADDAWHPMKNQIQYEYMIKHKDVFMSALRSSRYDLINVQSQKDRNIKTIKKKFIIFKNPIVTSTVMLLNTSEFRFSEKKRYAEDILLWQQIIFSDKKINLINENLAYSFKHPYRDEGLSNKLYLMEKEELKNFIFLYKNHFISLSYFLLASIFSIVKFIRRILILRLKS